LVHTDYCDAGAHFGCAQAAGNLPQCEQDTYVSSTYDNSVVSPYFDIATKYGFANYFFQTNQGPSMPAHQFLFSGTSAPSGDPLQANYEDFQSENPSGSQQQHNTGCTAPPSYTVKLIDPNGKESGQGGPTAVYPCFEHNSLPTLLDAGGVSWKYYTNSATGIWTAPNAVRPICQASTMPPNPVCTGPDWVNDVFFGPSQVLLDAGVSCGLRNVSWVIPNGSWSDHPGFNRSPENSTDIEGGPAWAAAIVNAVGQSLCTDSVNGQQIPYWQDTAILVVWDDWGGFYDHVPPFNVILNQPGTFGSGYVYGFRVPFLVVSAYTPAGYVSGACQSPGNCQNDAFPYRHDFGSILGFIENNFLGSNEIGQINFKYPFADNFAPDYKPGVHVPLADFFPLTSPRVFQAINLPGGSPDASYFINYNGTPEDPDNDAIDND